MSPARPRAFLRPGRPFKAGALTCGEDGINKWVEAKYIVEKDIDKMGDMMIARIEEKRAALGI